ncbi:MAG: hypothetical protein ACYC27_00830 [Armatimonadota bacterium]
MKKRTRIVAWILMIFTAYTFVAFMSKFVTMGHFFANVPWYIIAVTLLHPLQWIFWILLLRKQAWAWYVLTTVYTLLFAQLLYTLVIWISRVMSGPSSSILIKYLALNLVITVLPLWILLTDRPKMWTTKPDKALPEHN